MAEWSNAAVLKTVVRSRGPGVRIPLSPQTTYNRAPGCGFFVGGLPLKACFYDPFIWTGKIVNNLIAEWQVYEDTAENREQFGF